MAISPSTTEELLVEQKDRVLVLTLNRPERLNAISREMLSELSAKLVEANKDPDIRCIVLTGAGRGFCSGLDLIAVGEGLRGYVAGGAVPAVVAGEPPVEEQEPAEPGLLAVFSGGERVLRFGSAGAAPRAPGGAGCVPESDRKVLTGGYGQRSVRGVGDVAYAALAAIPNGE